jgi:ATP/maltotriose-dependent transcriptional regulator MalT
MANLKTLEDSIKNFAEIQGAQLAKRKNFNQKQFELVIKIKFYAALHDFMEIKSSGLKLSQENILNTHTFNASAFSRKELRNQLATQKPLLKNDDLLKKSFGDYNTESQIQLFPASKKKVVRDLHSEKSVLTNREQEVAELIAQEFSYKMISERLKVSIRTVHTHARNMHNKIGKHNVAGVINHINKNKKKRKPR